MNLDQAANPMFAYHQTFHPRFGWIKKGYTAAAKEPSVFLADNATVALGVGKNMVASIRYWGTAFRVLDRVPDPNNGRATISVPTPLGQAILDDESGYDPYFEDPGTLWLLHWHLVSATTDAPVWWSTFNSLPSIEFSESQLLDFVTDEVHATQWSPPSPGSIRKDVDCLLHMYVPRSARGRQGFDDVVDSPFRELALISATPGSEGRFRFNLGEKPGLSADMVTYFCLDYVARNEPDARTATITHLSNDPGTPGRLLKLTEDSLLKALTISVNKFSTLALTSPAGAPQLALSADPQALAAEVLHAHYAVRQPGIRQSTCEVAGTTARTFNTVPDGRAHNTAKRARARGAQSRQKKVGST